MSTPLIRVCAVNGTSVAPASSRSRIRTAPWRGRRSSGPRASRRRGSRAARRRRARARCTPGERQELGGLPVAERDRAGLVEQQRRAVAGRLDRAAREREHVPAHEPVHPGDPDRREQRADRRRDQADEQRDEHDRVLPVAGVDRERLQRHDGEQEDRGQADEQDVERDLVRRLLPRGALDERDHPVEEALAGPLRHPHDDLVGEHARAAGDRRAVAAGLADHRRGLAGDRRLVDARDPLDHLAVGRDQLAGRDDDDVALGEGARRDLLDRAVGAAAVRERLGARPPQRLGLRLAAALGDRLGEVREERP